MTSADYQNKLQTVMSNPKSDSAPDIFFNWADALMIQYARADVSAPLDEYMEKDPELKDNFLPSILDAAKVDGKYYGIPVRGVQPIVLSTQKCSLTTASKPRHLRRVLRCMREAEVRRPDADRAGRRRPVADAELVFGHLSAGDGQ